MSRVQLALNVPDLDAAVDFYANLFDTPPSKVRPGYANFAVADPPLKLVLIENGGAEPGSLNHLGIEVEAPAEVLTAADRWSLAGLAVTPEEGVTCCYAVQDKAWVRGPGGAAWEVYAVLTDAEMGTESRCCAASASSCC